MRAYPVLLLLGAIASCANPPEARVDDVRAQYRADAGLEARGLPAPLQRTLEERGWSRLSREEAAVRLEAAAEAEPDLRLDAAELHFLTGGEVGALHAARNAWAWMGIVSPRSGPAWDRGVLLYNAAVSAHVLGRRIPEGYDGVLAASAIPARSFRERVVRKGVGATLLGVRARTPKRDAAEPYLPRLDLGTALTAILRFDGPAPALEFHDPMTETEIDAFGDRLPLAADFTAPLAYLCEQVDLRRTPRTPSFERAGLVLLEPVRPDRIPVVFVHGLHANPADFRWMINELRADPVVRDRYQFLAYRYPSALPLAVLASDLRQQLARFWPWFDQRAPGARSGGYVVIGHGLGGLVAKTLAVNGGDGLFRSVFRVPRAEVDLSGELGESLSRMLFLERDPELARLVFLAVPHRGCDWTAGSTADAALRSVPVPRALIEWCGAVDKRWGDQLRPEVRQRLQSRSPLIDNVRTTDEYLLALAELPVEVPFDSVIGNLQGVTNSPTSDGIVAYSSAHLDGAESETIVRGDHDVHRTKHGVAAVRDALRRHAR